MSDQHRKMRGTALAAILALPLSIPAFAQQADDAQTEQSGDMTQQVEETAPDGTTTGDPMGAPRPDALVATVGDAEIRGEDVMAAVAMLPPQLQSQPPQMLVPIALEQLILRELILQEAQGENLAEDPEVIRMVEQTMQDAEENAMVQVWLDRQTEGTVTDEAVQQSYDEAKAQAGEDFPPLEQVRPQIEQHLSGQELQRLRTELREGADVVLYDPSGNPVQEPPSPEEMRQDSAGDAGSGQPADAPGEDASQTN